MSSAARAASRSAGRGTSLGTNPRSKPVTQLSQRRNQPLRESGRSGAGRGTALRGELHTTERSSLTSSILRQQDPARRNQSRPPRMPRMEFRNSDSMHFYEKATSKGRDDPDSKRKISDWYTSAARREALAGLAQATSGLKEASKVPGEVTQSVQPFAWADLSEVVSQLPDGHWAHGYVSGVANNIERNDAIAGAEKEKILGEVLQALGRLSREEDERFQDAEG